MRQRPLKNIGIDVTTGKDDDNRPASDLDAACHHGRKRHGAAGLENELQFAEGVGHRGKRLAVVNRDGARTVRLG